MKSGPAKFQVLLIEDEDQWTAQCIQFDISASATTLEDVLYAIERAIVGHQAVAMAEGIEPFKHMPPAPKRCQNLWSEARKMELESISPFSTEHGPPIESPGRELRYRRGEPQPC